MARIHKDDTVKIIAGKNKGTTGKVLKVNTKDQNCFGRRCWRRTPPRQAKPVQSKRRQERYPRTDGHQ